MYATDIDLFDEVKELIDGLCTFYECMKANGMWFNVDAAHEAHDALMCIGKKTYVSDTSRIKLSDNHYLKTSELVDYCKTKR